MQRAVHRGQVADGRLLDPAGGILGKQWRGGLAHGLAIADGPLRLQPGQRECEARGGGVQPRRDVEHELGPPTLAGRVALQGANRMLAATARSRADAHRWLRSHPLEFMHAGPGIPPL
jgi:hypothetical protein